MGASNIRIMAGIFEGARFTFREGHRFLNEIREMNGHYCWDIEYFTFRVRQTIVHYSYDSSCNDLREIPKDIFTIPEKLILYK